MTTDEIIELIKQISRQTVEDYFYQQQLDAEQQEQDEEDGPSSGRGSKNKNKNKTGMTDTGQKADKIETDVQYRDFK